MEIKVLGTGCAKCTKLEKEVYDALAELDVAANVEKVQDIKKIMEYKVMFTPALVINDKVKVAGKVPKKEELHQYIKEEI
ncbi:MAG: thioredoxin family protein [Syntrophomonadaceae bacterium]|nr:thioredoxin family protein [Syntrophomonadaceae bacterium]MDD3890350.1 thioredoxin family protein [Syntrophomonadaceae bacterium]MDD4549905.1 thioredoxin family protein [Syntrophomonadaceae bacterium]MDD4550469.1 thioredoxin family protein [Syntrophomonadaceae bacterium]